MDLVRASFCLRSDSFVDAPTRPQQPISGNLHASWPTIALVAAAASCESSSAKAICTGCQFTRLSCKATLGGRASSTREATASPTISTGISPPAAAPSAAGLTRSSSPCPRRRLSIVVISAARTSFGRLQPKFPLRRPFAFSPSPVAFHGISQSSVKELDGEDGDLKSRIHYYGMDLDPELLQIAEKWVAPLGLGKFEFIRGNALLAEEYPNGHIRFRGKHRAWRVS